LGGFLSPLIFGLEFYHYSLCQNYVVKKWTGLEIVNVGPNNDGT